MERWKRWSVKSSAFLNKTVARSALLVLDFYRVFISTLITSVFGHVCRFNPTCSQYARTAFEQHPPLTAGWLTMRRLCKCHPLGPFGHDPVPERKLS